MVLSLRRVVIDFWGYFCHFSFSKIHISGSEHKDLKIAEDVNIHVSQHLSKFQAEISRKTGNKNLKSQKLTTVD